MRISIIVIASVFLVACAGSGGSHTPSAPPATPVSMSYSGSTETVTYSDGSTQNHPATSNVITWAADHVTQTTTYTFADLTTNTVVATVPATVATTYSGPTQTIETIYGDGFVDTVNNTATSNAIAWAADHVTQTTIYTFADLTTNTVVATVLPTFGFSALPANYPPDWTTTGSVTKPNITNYTTTYVDGFTVSRSGLPNDPYDSDLVYSYGVTDPNAAVFTASSVVYDLRWGTPDINGPFYASLFPSGSPQVYAGAFTMWGQTVSGQSCASACGATIASPHPEVIDAWNQGWTGKGVNILIEDWLHDSHGFTTTVLANRYAPGSTFYGFDVSTDIGIYNFDGSFASPLSSTNIGVINASYGADLVALIGHAAPWTDFELTQAVAAFVPYANSDIGRYTGATTFTNFNLTDAVISKSAGNNSINADKSPFVNALAANPNTIDRLLVVGALNKVGLTSAPATIASYSNKAGVDTSVQSRFIVASGTTPYNFGDVALDGVAISPGAGTSFAAPRVAGYVAIVRSKFPNLNAVNTSSIMLDTARYDTLSCFATFGGCDKAIYGQGEVSLSRALAPVGRLR